MAVSHNPESNMKLASGTAKVPAMRHAGIPVGLGTDGAASNNDLDMFEAMRQAAFLHKLTTVEQRLPEWRTAIAKVLADYLEQVYSSGKTLAPIQQAINEHCIPKIAEITV